MERIVFDFSSAVSREIVTKYLAHSSNICLELNETGVEILALALTVTKRSLPDFIVQQTYQSLESDSFSLFKDARPS